MTQQITLQDYDKSIASIRDFTQQREVIKTSVVVVAYQSAKDLISCLDSLVQQDFHKPDFEIVVVDNGGNLPIHARLAQYPIKHILTHDNIGCSAGKNIGALFSKGEIICFIDDDGIADRHFVAAHTQAYQEYRTIVGARGKVLPKDPKNIYNELAYHYDLGSEVIPAYIDTETNASFRKSEFLAVGGFSSAVLRGDSEGIDISFRMVRKLGSQSVLVYYPDAIVYHDFANKLSKLIRKTISQEKARKSLSGGVEMLDEYILSYQLPPGIVHAPQDPVSRLRIKILWHLQYYYKQLKK